MIPTIDLERTGQNIKRSRKNAGLSVEEIRQHIGFSTPQAIYRWEQGKSVPSVDNLVIIASLYGVKVDDLIAVK